MNSHSADASTPLMRVPTVPSGHKLWTRAVTVASILVILFTLHRIGVMLAHYWLLESMDLASVFWTNFRMGALLYVTALAGYAAAAWIPAYLHPLKTRAWIMTPGFLLATIAAYFLALHYGDFLFGAEGIGFGEAEPVFEHDLGFYVFDLPYIWISWRYLLGAACIFLGSSVACAFVVRDQIEPPAGLSALAAFLGSIATLPVRIGVVLVGLISAIGVWLQRYELLIWDNSASSVYIGAEYVDVTGLFSNLNYINVTSFVVLGITAALFLLLGRLARAAGGSGEPRWAAAGWMILAFIALDFGFKVAVEVRDMVAVKPNEPVIQLEYIARHIDATRKAYSLDDIEAIDYLPNGQDVPLPDVDEILANPTMKNAPLWPGFVSYLERLLDPQHAERILQTAGDPMIYGPTLDIFQQEQKLRTYYRFMSVDNVRYMLDGEKRMLVSAVRELPLYEPVPWLNYWGQRYMLFTHGFGIAMAFATDVTDEGTPRFVSYDIPGEVDYPQLALGNERVYYGEGSETMAFSNVDRMKELDYPTEQDRAEILLSEDVRSGVYLDSFLKRVVFGWLSGRLAEFVFSDLINDGTRVHYIRTPVERLEQVAPFLYYDSNPYAVVSDGSLTWLVNGLTTSDRYPYSRIGELGDKADERAIFPRPTRWVNYIEDSVKATVDAFDGSVRLYRLADAPVVSTWAAIYPELFTDIDEMPEGMKQQLTYPAHLFHIQFDDLYIYYHMQDPMYFFNLEDMWDDGDEVLGPVLDSGKSITFSLEPYNLILPTDGLLPESEQDTQYSLVMAFTPEKALNLRAIPVVYQDWPDYGKKAVLQVPKGTYSMGPEQADAIIDQDPEISQKLALWNRIGMDVIRGHTTVLPIGKEVFFVEPIFLRSEQNPVSQLKKVAVVFREKVALGDTLADGVRAVIAMHAGEANAQLARAESTPAPAAAASSVPAEPAPAPAVISPSASPRGPEPASQPASAVPGYYRGNSYAHPPMYRR